jgi:hypothetical protein
MNQNATSIDAIEILPGRIARGRIRCLPAPGAAIALARPVRSHRLAPAAEPRAWLALAAANHRTAEFWETLNFLVLWVSGLVAIGCCLL